MYHTKPILIVVTHNTSLWQRIDWYLLNSKTAIYFADSLKKKAILRNPFYMNFSIYA